MGLPRSWNPDARSLIHQTLFSRLVRPVCWSARVIETILEHTLDGRPARAIAPLLASTNPAAIRVSLEVGQRVGQHLGSGAVRVQVAWLDIVAAALETLRRRT